MTASLPTLALSRPSRATPRQERFRSMAPLYYRGALAAILVFSLCDAQSFERLKEWVR